MTTLLRTMAEKSLDRKDLVRLLAAAIQTGENRYARMLALSWLAVYPGDLPVNFVHAQAMVREGLVRQSLPVLDNLCQIDPEFLEAQMLLADARHLLNLESAKEAEASVLALGGAPKNRRALPKW